MTDKPYHVLITRLSAIGDCILTLPLARALKKSIPNARVSWCVSCAGRHLIERCPDVDQVIAVDRRWLASPREWRRIRQTLTASPIDCVIDAQSLSKSAMIGRLSGAPLRVGFAAPRGKELAPWLNTCVIETGEDQHLVDAQLSLLRALDIEPGPGEFRLDIPTESHQWATQQIAEFLSCPNPLFINPGAGWESRVWPSDRFGLVARWVHQHYQVPSLVVWAGEEERAFAEEISRVSQGAAIVAPSSNLIQLAALLSRGRLLLTGDTGPMHIAAAVGTRCLSLHGPTNPLRSGPYGPQHRSIRKVAFEGSSRVRRKADNSSMKAIEVADVCDVLAIMLDEQAAAA